MIYGFAFYQYGCAFYQYGCALIIVAYGLLCLRQQYGCALVTFIKINIMVATSNDMAAQPLQIWLRQ
jgi:hypothetical protein